MQSRDLMYALHIVSLHLTITGMHKTFFCSYLGPYDHSHLFITQVIDLLPQAHVLLAIASACALF